MISLRKVSQIVIVYACPANQRDMLSLWLATVIGAMNNKHSPALPTVVNDTL